MLRPMLESTRRASVASPIIVVALILAACGSKAEPVANEAKQAHEARVDPRAASHLERSLELERGGDLVGAVAEAEAAVAVDGGRDARVQAAKLAILRNQHRQAIELLLPLAESSDAVVQYNLALAYQHEGDYNRARNGYLTALRVDPSQADARYNLAVLCHERGVHEEARHHVAKFVDDYADDPRRASLERMIGPPPAPE
jgi:tetratricopeptide (TPR) repeat protein